MKRVFAVFLYIVVVQIFSFNILLAQNDDVLRVAFWNLENFFDPFVDTTRNYNEYTENGSQRWTLSRFYKKRNNLYKTILALSQGKPIAILGVCEVENTFVTTMLFYETPLKKHNYRIIHYEGSDKRGIDVAMVYSIDKLQLVDSKAFALRNPKNAKFRSRDILYAKFYDRVGDTLHCFVNHWPSRYGGEKETIELRNLAAYVLKQKIDSLIHINENMPKIIIMGDFNDTPRDESILKVLKAKPIQDLTVNDTLINLFSDEKNIGFEGTIKHQYHWQIFDQIIISKSLISDCKSLFYIDNSAKIFHPDFLLIDDDTYGGKKLFRTYIGPKYQGGYSDHLPVFIELKIDSS